MGWPTALITLVLLALAPPARAQETRPAPAPPPQLLAGIELHSTLVYDADPKTPHTLRVTFAGAEHARWWLGAGPEGAETRLARSRSGERVFALLLAGSGSVELGGAERDAALVQLELRRALVQFPQFSWKGEGKLRSASLGRLGSLRARFEDEQAARPVEIAHLDAAGKEGDAYRSIRWSQAAGGATPAALELWHEGARIWTESVRSVAPTTATRDLFLPVDQREGPAAPSVMRIVQSPAPEHAARRFELAAGADWAVAKAEIERLRAEWTARLAPLGLELEARATVELAETLAPRAVVLRLSKVPEMLPDGFERVRGRSAAGLLLEGFDKLDPRLLRVLHEKVPANAKPGKPYVRWALAPDGEKQLLLLVSWASEG